METFPEYDTASSILPQHIHISIIGWNCFQRRAWNRAAALNFEYVWPQPTSPPSILSTAPQHPPQLNPGTVCNNTHKFEPWRLNFEFCLPLPRASQSGFSPPHQPPQRSSAPGGYLAQRAGTTMCTWGTLEVIEGVEIVGREERNTRWTRCVPSHSHIWDHANMLIQDQCTWVLILHLIHLADGLKREHEKYLGEWAIASHGRVLVPSGYWF